MLFGFSTLEKLKEVFNALRQGVWYLVPILGFFHFVHWILTTWLPARALEVLDRVQALIPEYNVDFSAVGIAWERINQWFPLSEFVAFSTAYLGLAALLTFLRWMRLCLPFS
jgi:hypothetical protein